MNITGIEKAKVYPLNNQASYSPYRNNSVLNFEIAPQADRMIDPRSIRLNFVFEVRKTADNALPDNDVNIDDRVGLCSIFDLVRVRQQNTNQVLEETRNYGFMCASSMPAGLSLNNYKKFASQYYSATGRSEAQKELITKPVPASLILKTGLFSGQQLWNLQALGGIKLELVMNSLSQVLYGANASEYFYQIKDVNLSFNYVTLASPIKSQQYSVAYPQYTSFTSVLSSSNDQLSIVFAQNQVRSVFSTTIKSDKLNNFTQNAFTTDRIKDAANPSADKKVKELILYKDSVKFPFDYIVNERDATDNGVYLCLKNKLFLDCFRQFTAISNILQSTTTQGTKSHREAKYGFDVANGRAYTGLGVNYDMLRNSASVSFRNSMFSMRVNSELTDGTPNNVMSFTLSNRMLKTNPMNSTIVN